MLLYYLCFEHQMLYQLMSGYQSLHRYCLFSVRTCLELKILQSAWRVELCKWEMSLIRRITPQRKESIQPWPILQHVTDNTTFSHDLHYNMWPISPHSAMTYPTTCDRYHHIQPWPTLQHMTDNTTFSHDLPYNMWPITPQTVMTYPTTCDR